MDSDNSNGASNSYVVGDFFPHETIRPSQKDLVEDIDKAIENKKVILAHAPTGLGKTASALSVAMYHSFKSKERKKVIFLTNRHTQHQIAIKTIAMIKKKLGENIISVDLIGKRWMCNQEISGVFGNDFGEFCKALVDKGECDYYLKVKDKSKLTVEAKAKVLDLAKSGPYNSEQMVKICKDSEMCSYEVSLALGKGADLIIGDYYYAFNPFVQTTLFNKLDIDFENVILIVDEAHNLPGRVADMLSSNLSTLMLNYSVLEARKFHYKGLIYWIQELNRILLDLAVFSKNEKEKKVDCDDFINRVKKIVAYDQLVNELEIASDEVRKKQKKSYLGSIAKFLESWKGESVGFTRIISEKNSKQGPQIVLKYSCLDPSIITRDVFSKVHSAILMSGTLKPTFMYKDLLGISDGVEKEYGSPFPRKNKLSLIVPRTSTKYSVRGDAMYQKIADICQDLSFKIKGNVALFFPSYFFRDEVCKYIKSEKTLLWERSGMSKEEKEMFLADFEKHKEKGAVLFGVTGANFAEGVDFAGDLLNGVVIIGLPLARPDLKIKETISYYDKKFGQGWNYGYTFPAMNKCMQSAGRCIRSETDRGIVIYLDERFAWKNYYDCLPREGIIVAKEYDKFLNRFHST
jgi:DNA excision repair protein ERCC-2